MLKMPYDPEHPKPRDLAESGIMGVLQDIEDEPSHLEKRKLILLGEPRKRNTNSAESCMQCVREISDRDKNNRV